MSSQKFAYARVSSKTQNLDRQLDELKAKDENGNYKYISDERNLFYDKVSGKDTNRDEFKLLMRMLREGDELTITSLDRLSRSYDDIHNIWSDLNDRGVLIRVLDMPLISTADKHSEGGIAEKIMTNMTLELLAYNAQKEREHIRERQAQGIASAKAKGKRFGRPKKNLPDNADEIMRQYHAKELTAVKTSQLLGVSRAQFYRMLKDEKGD